MHIYERKGPGRHDASDFLFRSARTPQLSLREERPHAGNKTSLSGFFRSWSLINPQGFNHFLYKTNTAGQTDRQSSWITESPSLCSSAESIWPGSAHGKDLGKHVARERQKVTRRVPSRTKTSRKEKEGFPSELVLGKGGGGG